MFYTHPWEIDHDQPRLNHRSKTYRFRHCLGLRHTEDKLKRLLRSFRFAPMRDVLEDVEQSLSPFVPSPRWGEGRVRGR